MKNKARIIAASAACLISLTSCSSKKSDVNKVTGEFSVTFLDVGKADSMILRTQDHTVVIDCGEKGDGKNIISELESINVTEIDCLIITHYDQDHVGGAAKLIKNADIKKVIAPDYSEDNEETQKYEAALAEMALVPEIITDTVDFTLDDVHFTVYPPQRDDYGKNDDNDFSLVTKVVHGSNVLLFTGDAMEMRLNEIMDIGQCDLLKVPYHGRYVNNLGDFLDKTAPQYAVISTSEKELSEDVTALLDKRGIASYPTCTCGKITAVSDGTSLAFSTEN